MMEGNIYAIAGIRAESIYCQVREISQPNFPKIHKGLGLPQVLKKVLKKGLKKNYRTQKSTQKRRCTQKSTHKINKKKVV